MRITLVHHDWPQECFLCIMDGERSRRAIDPRSAADQDAVAAAGRHVAEHDRLVHAASYQVDDDVRDILRRQATRAFLHAVRSLFPDLKAQVHRALRDASSEAA